MGWFSDRVGFYSVFQVIQVFKLVMLYLLLVAIFLSTTSVVVSIYEAETVTLTSKKSIRLESELKEIIIMNENWNSRSVFGDVIPGKNGAIDEDLNITKNPSEIFTPRMALVYSMISAILVGLTGILPLIMLTKAVNKSDRNLNRFLSFAVGGLLGDVFLHLLPESWNSIMSSSHENFYSAAVYNGSWVLFGLIIFWCLEKLFPDVETERKGCDQKTYQNCNGNNNNKKDDFCCQEKCHTQNSEKDIKTSQTSTVKKSNVKMAGYLNLLANFTDNFSHGLAVGGSYLVSKRVGMLTTGAILLHEIPHEIGDFSILLRAGFDRWYAAKMQLLTASGGLLGALFAHILESNTAGVAWILPFTAGGFLYIALSNVVPDLLRDTMSRKESCLQVFLIILAIVSMQIISVIE